MDTRRIQFGQIAVIARKEFRDRLRSRWVLAVAVVLTVFALVIAYFGAAQQGAVGFKGIELTIASLTSLVIYLVPLIALILGYDAIVGERERGSLDLLLSLPLTRLELLLGKYLGLAAALAFSTVAGFGLVGVVLSYGIGLTGLLDYAGFILSTLLMGLAFLSLALLFSVLTSSKVVASGAAIALWFFYVLIYDLMLVGILVVTEGQYVGGLFPILLLLNPADIFRILNIFSLEEVKSLYGLATVFPATLASPWLLGGAMLFWILTPLALAYVRFRKLS
jgi:Cu-processing system permease protein